MAETEVILANFGHVVFREAKENLNPFLKCFHAFFMLVCRKF